MFEHEGCWVYKADMPTCPHCKMQFTTSDMERSTQDLWALPKNEERIELTCPSCNNTFWCEGGFDPHYNSAANEDDL
jgi:hypothetical protein